MPNWEDLTYKEREDYINQDYSRQVESVIPRHVIEGVYTYDSYLNYPDIANKNSGGNMKHLIILLYEDGKSVKDIAYHLPCTIRYINKIIKCIKDKNKEYRRKYSKSLSKYNDFNSLVMLKSDASNV